MSLNGTRTFSILFVTGFLMIGCSKASDTGSSNASSVASDQAVAQTQINAISKMADVMSVGTPSDPAAAIDSLKQAIEDLRLLSATGLPSELQMRVEKLIKVLMELLERLQNPSTAVNPVPVAPPPVPTAPYDPSYCHDKAGNGFPEGSLANVCELSAQPDVNPCVPCRLDPRQCFQCVGNSLWIDLASGRPLRL